MTFCDRSGFYQVYLANNPTASDYLSALLMTLDKIHQYQTTPTEDRSAAVYNLSAIASLSSDSSYSDYAGDHSTGSYGSYNKIPPREVINTLDLLERAEQKVSHDVARIRDKIREARESVEAYRREKRERVKKNAALIAEEERQTRRTDDELWLVV